MADPGQWRIQDFPGEGVDVKSYYLAIFSPKLHEIERIWTWGARPWHPSLDPPMQDFPDGKGADSKRWRAPTYYSGRSRIFLWGGANSKSECANLFFANFLPKTAWKWNNLDPPMYYLAKFSSKMYKIHKGLYFNLIWREFAFIPPDGSIGLGWIMIL